MLCANVEQLREWLKSKPDDYRLTPDEVSDDEVIRALRSVPVHKAALTYLILNCAAPTTAAPVKQPTGNAIRTMMQVRPGVGTYGRIIEWGCSFDASAAATPGQVELFETTVAATMSTAYLNPDIMPYGNANAPANASNEPVDITSTSTSGFATAAVTEGTVANYRGFDAQLLPPTQPYVKQFPLGREPEMKAQNYTRVRVTFGTTVNMTCYLLIEF